MKMNHIINLLFMLNIFFQISKTSSKLVLILMWHLKESFVMQSLTGEALYQSLQTIAQIIPFSYVVSLDLNFKIPLWTFGTNIWNGHLNVINQIIRSVRELCKIGAYQTTSIAKQPNNLKPIWNYMKSPRTNSKGICTEHLDWPDTHSGACK